MAKEKIGAGSLSAAARQGLHELSQVLPAFPESNVRPVEVMGALGSPTPQQIHAEQQQDPVADYDALLAREAAAAPKERQRDKGHEM